MGIKYKKVITLYALIALLAILILRCIVFKSISQLHELQYLNEQIGIAEKTIKEQGLSLYANSPNNNDGIQNLLISTLESISASGCPVFSGTPIQLDSPDAYPMYNIEIVFGGDFPNMQKALLAIDSLSCSNSFETAATVCRIGVERSSDGRSWQLVCHETLQYIPNLLAATDIEFAHCSLTGNESPFYIPETRAYGGDKNKAEVIRPKGTIRKGLSQNRLIGRICDGKEAIVILEIGGEYIQLNNGDDRLLNDNNDSVRVVWGSDTLIIKRN